MPNPNRSGCSANRVASILRNASDKGAGVAITGESHSHFASTAALSAAGSSLDLVEPQLLGASTSGKFFPGKISYLAATPASQFKAVIRTKVPDLKG